VSCGTNQLYSHDDDSKKPTVLPLCSEHCRVLICGSFAEQSAGSTGAKVPFRKRFCIKPARLPRCKTPGGSPARDKFSHYTMKTIALRLRIPDIPIALVSIQNLQSREAWDSRKEMGALTSERLAYFASSAVLFKRRAIWRIAKSSKAYLCETRRAHIDKESDIRVTSMLAHLKSSASFARCPPRARRI
jgi:hypothetical protein